MSIFSRIFQRSAAALIERERENRAAAWACRAVPVLDSDNERTRAYLKAAAVAWGQCGDIERSGWSDEAKRCAILNMTGMAVCLEGLVECERSGINTLRNL